jgi:hypothetical protein
MSQKVVATLFLGALLFTFCLDGARATADARPIGNTAPSVEKTLRKHSHVSPRPSLTIVSKTPNDAPDFDYRSRIHEAQVLIAKQPVLTDDMQIDDKGALSHFSWLIAVGKTTGPLTLVRMDETGKNDQGFTITWPVDNFINTHFHVTKPEGYIVFAQRRPVHAEKGFQEAVYTAYSPELDTKTMRDYGMNYLREMQQQAYEQIKDYDVRSRVAPNLTVAAEIPASMVLRLMITEHIDPLHMKYVGMEQCIHEILFTLAANKLSCCRS